MEEDCKWLYSIVDNIIISSFKYHYAFGKIILIKIETTSMYVLWKGWNKKLVSKFFTFIVNSDEKNKKYEINWIKNLQG